MGGWVSGLGSACFWLWLLLTFLFTQTPTSQIKADVAAVQHKLDTFQREGEMARTGGGHGGLGGVLYALGVEHHGGVVALDGVAGVAEELLDDDIAMELDFVSVPSECETLLRETQAAWGDAMASSGSSSSS